MGMFGRKSQTTAEMAAEQNVVVPAAARTISLRKESGSAVSLEKVESLGKVDFTKKFTKASFALNQVGMDGVRVAGVMLLDKSGSMGADYKNGTVQKIVERALAFLANIDSDGTMPIIPFDDKTDQEVVVTLDNFDGVVNREIYKNGRARMGGTNMRGPLEAVRDLAKVTNDPVFLVVVGDGSPWDAEETKEIVIELANYPVFIKFLSVRQVDFLDELDDLGDDERLLDNVDAKDIFNPDSLTDLEFATLMADEFMGWVELATSKGVLNS